MRHPAVFVILLYFLGVFYVENAGGHTVGVVIHLEIAVPSVTG